MTVDTQNTTDELLEVVASLRFARSYKRTGNSFVLVSLNEVIRTVNINESIRKSVVLQSSISSFLRELNVQLWSVNQRTTEAEEVTDS
jgi:uncharacterized membrane protein (DUF373 family)